MSLENRCPKTTTGDRPFREWMSQTAVDTGLSEGEGRVTDSGLTLYGVGGGLTGLTL